MSKYWLSLDLVIVPELTPAKIQRAFTLAFPNVSV